MSRICLNNGLSLISRPVCLIASVLVVGAATAQQHSEPAANVQRYFAHLRANPLPTVHVADVRVGGVSVWETDGARRIRQNQETAVSLDLALAIAPAARTAIRIHVTGHSGAAERTHWIATDTWRVGSLNEWTGTVRVPPLTLSGYGTLTILQLLPKSPGPTPLGDRNRIPVDEAVLFRGPVFVEPSTTASRVTDALLEDVFGSSEGRCNTAFRLSPSTTIRIELPERNRRTVSRLGIIAALGGGYDVDQGESVVRILSEPSGDEFEVAAGEDVSFIDVAVPPTGVIALRPVASAATATAPFVNWHNAPVAASIYSTVWECKPAQSIEALTFEYTRRTGYIDVYDIVCLRGAPATP